MILFTEIMKLYNYMFCYGSTIACSCHDNPPSSFIDGDPSNYLTYFKRAAVYLAIGQAKRAIPDLDSSIELKKDFHQVRKHLTSAYTVAHLLNV